MTTYCILLKYHIPLDENLSEKWFQSAYKNKHDDIRSYYYYYGLDPTTDDGREYITVFNISGIDWSEKLNSHNDETHTCKTNHNLLVMGNICISPREGMHRTRAVILAKTGSMIDPSTAQI